MNGADDDRTDPAQAQPLADSITRRGGKARAIIYAKVGHQIPVALRNREIDRFIDEVLGARGHGTDGGAPTPPA
jgi:dipeptidyl aminopeptidase/acylaminoacyl peptidase